ncbi:MAG: hypothetical protein EHM65_09705 [Acidobacteriales bacterium]|nr:MAG: hypothetical protein EHM65_09705 [Terriglobales bacterium]
MLVVIIGAVLLIVGSFAAGIVAMILRSQARERLQKERMLLLEKGLEVPRELYVLEAKPAREPQSVRMGLRLAGTFFSVVGIFPVMVIALDDGFPEALNGSIFLFFGMALLLCERLLAWAGFPLSPK